MAFSAIILGKRRVIQVRGKEIHVDCYPIAQWTENVRSEVLKEVAKRE